jgi:hypothetical protein
MTREEIIKLAREAGLFVPHEGIPENGAFMRFATTLLAKEREECAKLAAWILKMPENDVSHAIRARGMK